MLHLIDQQTCERSPATAAHLADLAGSNADDHRVVLIGRAHAGCAVGLSADQLIDTPASAMWLGRWALAKQVRAYQRDNAQADRANPNGVIVAWSAKARALLPRALRQAARSADDLPLAIDTDRLACADRQTLRDQWEAEPDDRFVLLLGDAPEQMNAAAGLLATGLAGETGRRWRLVISERARGMMRAYRMTESMDRADRMVVDDRADRPWLLMSGLDAVLAFGPGCRRGMAWAMAGGVAIAADESAAMSVGLVDDQHALVGPAGQPRSQSQALCRLHDQPQLRAKLTQAAGRELTRLTQLLA